MHDIRAKVSWTSYYQVLLLWTDTGWRFIAESNHGTSVGVTLPNHSTIALINSDQPIPIPSPISPSPDPDPVPDPDPDPDPVPDPDPIAPPPDPAPAPTGEVSKELSVIEDQKEEQNPQKTDDLSKDTSQPSRTAEQTEEPISDGQKDDEPNGLSSVTSEASGTKQTTGESESAGEESSAEPSAPQSPGNPAATGDGAGTGVIFAVLGASAAATLLAVRKMKKPE